MSSISRSPSPVENQQAKDIKAANSGLKQFLKTNGVSAETFTEAAVQFPTATKIEFKSKNLTSEAFATLNKMPDLAKVTIDFEPKERNECPSLSEEALCTFFKIHTHLQKVDLSGISSITPQVIDVMAESCKELKKIELDASKLNLESLLKILQMPNVTSFRIINANFLDDQKTQELLNNCERLDALSILDSQTAHAFNGVKRLENITVFSMNNLTLYSDEVFSKIQTVMPNLKHLTLENVSDSIRKAKEESTHGLSCYMVIV